LQSKGNRTYQVGRYLVDLERREIGSNGSSVFLGWRQFEALRLLIEAHGDVVARERFFERLWKGAAVDESNLTKCISQIRKGLRDGDAGAEYVETIPGVGYRLAASVAPVESPSDVAGHSAPSQPVAVPRPHRRWNWIYVLAAGFILSATFGVGVQWRDRANLRRQAREALQEGENLSRRGDYAGAVNVLQRAIQLDPRLAMAYGALAHALHRQAGGAILPRPDRTTPSIEAARKAVALEPDCAKCQATFGFFLFYHGWQWASAEIHLRDSIRLDPNDESLRPPMAMLMAATSRPRDALEHIDFAVAKRPYRASWHGIRAVVLYQSRRFPEAVQAAEQALSLDGNEKQSWDTRGKALIQMGRGEEGVVAIAQGHFGRNSPEANLIVKSGGTEAGLRKLLDLTRGTVGEAQWAWRRALWYATLNEVDQALDGLETAYRLGNLNVLYFETEPMLDPVRSHARYRELARQVGIRAGER
jgi:DNA-binding winged helix-turn-helix (wHTH) protein/Flp pilus assembly protein TadD